MGMAEKLQHKLLIVFLCAHIVVVSENPYSDISWLYPENRSAITPSTNEWAPHHYKMQYLTRAGFISAGAGYNVGNVYEPTLLIGYMHQFIEGKSRNAPVISLKNSFNIYGRSIPDRFNLKAGLSLNLALSENTFEKIPVYNKRRPYFQNRFYVSPYFGGEWLLNSRKERRHKYGLYAELSTLDSYLVDFSRSRFVDFDEIWTLMFGVTVYPF